MTTLLNYLSLPQCDMRAGCGGRVTHIGEKGYVYCAACVPSRQGVERCRKMRQFERRLLATGNALPSYAPLSKPETLRLVAERKVVA